MLKERWQRFAIRLCSKVACAIAHGASTNSTASPLRATSRKTPLFSCTSRPLQAGSWSRRARRRRGAGTGYGARGARCLLRARSATRRAPCACDRRRRRSLQAPARGQPRRHWRRGQSLPLQNHRAVHGCSDLCLRVPHEANTPPRPQLRRARFRRGRDQRYRVCLLFRPKARAHRFRRGRRPLPFSALPRLCRESAHIMRTLCSRRWQRR
mmetsp:Transcript_7611/g.25208  ORF Transcript_7611/g.25208 Transcript_7611/m.25208 type:complete len:211 (+) Transcript_7611:883-1515(+)